MEKSLFFLISRLKVLGGSALAVYFLICVQSNAFGQASNAPANKFAPLTAPTHTNLQVKTSQTCVPLCSDDFENLDRVTDNNFSNHSDWNYGFNATGWLEVKDNSATDTEVYRGGSYAGFVIDNNAVGLLSSITIKTYLGGSSTPVETKTGVELLSVSGIFDGAGRIGFWTGAGKDFDRVRIEFGGLGLGGKREIYYAEVIRYAAGPALVCNTPTTFRLSDVAGEGFPVSIAAGRTGVNGVCVGCSVTDQAALIDSDPLTSAKITMGAALNSSASISVATVGQINPGGTYAGFDLSNVNLLGVGVVSGITVETYRNGAPTNESVSGASLLNVSSTLVAGSERKIVGFQTSADFDEVRLTVAQTGVSLGTTQVFGLVLTKFCSDAPLVCNTPTTARNPANSVYVDGRHTGITSAACVGCAIKNPEYAIDDDAATSAQIVTVVGGIATASFAVSNAIATYGENSFAGFDIETKSLANATAFGTATVELLLNGVVVAGSSSGAIVLGVNSILVNGTNRQTIGIVAKSGVTYNGVKITFNKGVGVDLGEIEIHGAVFQKNCAGTEITCGQSFNLNLPGSPSGDPNFPVVINSARTGYSGVACVGCFVNDAWNVISPSTTDYAEIGNLLTGLGRSSISVYSPINVYPVGVFAGFTIKKENFTVAASLFDQLTVRTFKKGVLQEEMTGGSLLNLTLTTQIFGTSSDFYNVGFVAQKSFDEISIGVASLAALADDYIKVYGAFVDTRTASGGTLRCFNTNPDNNVGLAGVVLTGNVSTNDIVATGTTYGTPVVVPGQTNPSAVLPVMNANGTYTFTATAPGVYSFNVPVCVPEQPECVVEALTITILGIRSTSFVNTPVANDDITMTVGDPTTPASIVYDVRMNDRPGNNSGTLQLPTIETAPSNGTATIEDGKVKYTPNPGFYGKDIVTYEICETPSGKCTNANLVVTVLDPEGQHSITASDDYVYTVTNQTITMSAEEGVLANDVDPIGHTLTVTEQDITVDDAGTLNLNADGGYTFTPSSNFTGSVNFPYTACDDFGNCQNATLIISAVGNETLPVTLVRFDVQKEGQFANLNWLTSSETNSGFFEIQQSVDAKDWKVLGALKSAGESTVQTTYNFTHKTPYQGVNYYRLRMVDLDGSQAFSSIRTIRFDGQMRAGIYPNPAVSNFTIDAPDWNGIKTVEMVRLDGVTVYRSGKMPVNQIDARNFAGGIYILKLTRNDGTVEKIKAVIAR